MPTPIIRGRKVHTRAQAHPQPAAAPAVHPIPPADWRAAVIALEERVAELLAECWNVAKEIPHYVPNDADLLRQAIEHFMFADNCPDEGDDDACRIYFGRVAAGIRGALLLEHGEQTVAWRETMQDALRIISEHFGDVRPADDETVTGNPATPANDEATNLCFEPNGGGLMCFGGRNDLSAYAARLSEGVANLSLLIAEPTSEAAEYCASLLNDLAYSVQLACRLLNGQTAPLTNEGAA